DVRRSTYDLDAREISRANGSLRSDWIDELKEDLASASARVRPGISLGAGSAIEKLQDASAPMLTDRNGRATVERLRRDLEEFVSTASIDRLVVVNVASTEPPAPSTPAYRELDAFEHALDTRPSGELRPGALYAYAALSAKAAYINFTASNSP